MSFSTNSCQGHQCGGLVARTAQRTPFVPSMEAEPCSDISTGGARPAGGLAEWSCKPFTGMDGSGEGEHHGRKLWKGAAHLTAAWKQRPKSREEKDTVFWVLREFLFGFLFVCFSILGSKLRAFAMTCISRSFFFFFSFSLF